MKVYEPDGKYEYFHIQSPYIGLSPDYHAEAGAEKDNAEKSYDD